MQSAQAVDEANIETSREKAAEYLRLTLPLMTRHDVPTTPQNYAVWYTYVVGYNEVLNDEVDSLIAKGTTFTAVLNARLYREHLAEHDLDTVDRVRGNLTAIVQEVGESIINAEENADAFEGTLGGIADDVSRQTDMQSVRNLLTQLLAETRSMRASNTSLQAHFEAKSKEIEFLQKELDTERKRSLIDPLTGLFNRLALFDRIEEATDNITDDATPSFIMFDIDHFKSINDTHGHLIGDRVIRFVAKTLQDNIKGQDTAARFGGEEFAVLLPGTPGSGAIAVAESIRKLIEEAKLVRADNKKPLGNITISAGIATYRPGDDVMEFIDRADQALYTSKNDGRNRVSSID